MKPQCKQSYFEEMSVDPLLVELYHDRLGDVNRILDLGCGTGSVGAYLPDSIETVGLDIDQVAVERASTHERVILTNLESGSLPFHEEVFDGVIAKDILEHLERPSSIVNEIYSVLRPGGRAVVSVPMAKPHVVWNDYTHVRGFTVQAFRTMMRDHDFTVELIEPMGGIPGAGRLGLTKQLPRLLSLPLLARFATSHEGVFRKPSIEE